MSAYRTRAKRRKFAVEEASIRQIIQQWLPTGFPVPQDQYDCLVHQLVSALHAGATLDDLACRIRDDIENHFGLGPLPDDQVYGVAGRVLRCWIEAAA